MSYATLATDRFHLVAEVADINAAHAALPLSAPTPQTARGVPGYSRSATRTAYP
jgi:hypothetical protein